MAAALQEMELHKLADEVNTKYGRGMDMNHVACFHMIMIFLVS